MRPGAGGPRTRRWARLGPVQLVATDLDGTVVGADWSISPRTMAALRACELAGVRVLVVTGRPARWLPPELAHLDAPAVCANGAAIFDRTTNRYLRTWGIDRTVVAEVVHRLKQLVPGAAVALETTEGFRREPDYVNPWSRSVTDVLPTEELLQVPGTVLKILLRGPERGPLADEMLAAVGPALAGELESTHSNSGDSLLELGPAGVSKASTVEHLCAEWGIPADQVVAFGDQPNDVPLLRWAGAGYAMFGGHPAALASADAVAPPLAQDGVAQILERMLDGAVGGPRGSGREWGP